MSDRTSDAEMQLMRKNYRERQERCRRELEERLEQARKHFDRIVEHIARTYHPKRIWQWGQLIDGHHFSERSDIDIALEGIDDPKTHFAILGDAMDLSSLPVDVVQIEKIHPEYGESIRSRGRIVCEGQHWGPGQGARENSFSRRHPRRTARSVPEKQASRIGRTDITAAFAAQIIVNSCTALATLFRIISQYFENNLDTSSWHTDLLDTMKIHVPGVRERVLSERTHALMLELLKFRHFRRYYFDVDLDWHRMDFLLGVYDRALPLVRADIEQFKDFLRRLAAD